MQEVKFEKLKVMIPGKKACGYFILVQTFQLETSGITGLGGKALSTGRSDTLHIIVSIGPEAAVAKPYLKVGQAIDLPLIPVRFQNTDTFEEFKPFPMYDRKWKRNFNIIDVNQVIAYDDSMPHFIEFQQTEIKKENEKHKIEE
jgi:hypothetical protein